MRWRNPGTSRRGSKSTLGIVVLILSLVHTPLPQPDFHNIRHHDGAGEVCEYHDHLLRWHPGASAARDVAMLHWHWFLAGPAGADSDPTSEAPGKAIHAHVPAWQASTWDDGLRLVAPDTSASRIAASPAPCPSPLDFVADVPGPAWPGGASTPGLHPSLGFGATFAPGVSLASRLHRWVC